MLLVLSNRTYLLVIYLYEADKFYSVWYEIQNDLLNINITIVLILQHYIFTKNLAIILIINHFSINKLLPLQFNLLYLPVTQISY